MSSPRKRGSCWNNPDSIPAFAGMTIQQNNRRRLWGRRMTRGLGKARTLAYERLMPVIGIAVDKDAKNINPFSFFEDILPSPAAPPARLPLPIGERVGVRGERLGTTQQEFILEIGFGNGEHLIALMDQYSDAFYIGAEPFLNGIAAFLNDMGDRPKNNIRVFPDDAMLLVNVLADESIDKIYALNPDPWPKKRHHKRRLINRENLDQFARVLKPGGSLIMATDVDDLAEWMVTQSANHKAFEWTAENSKDWQTPPAEWTETRYAFKGKKAGRRQSFLIFKKTCKTHKKNI
jgi:tRNA (guanine-N7-)-methyltransferase